ncbi:formate dehydrogenase subunit delta [Azospirillum isscasi]|uniref:Formate dehydrogenase subunit delta n=1 Tax=Azospirillum isscasi TaxID=3053926 RepID=A0ABU0WF16_9PROT|nr:formate dehydrogenase subunit delta [Azospirillum isscasi]MDQ2102731.1 formate dehydrogenase subunit delta [Azospirillum isscasi]
MDTTREIIRMANQIAGYFQSYPQDEAVTETAGHIRTFWEPRMRQRLLDHSSAGGEGLHEIVTRAVERLRVPPVGSA